MGNLGLDLTNVEAQDFTPVPSGTYDFIIHDMEIATSKASGNNMIKAKFKVINHDKYNGKIVYDIFAYTHEVGKQRLKTLGVVIGLNAQQLADVDTNDMISKKFKGTVVIETDSYGDKNKMKKMTAIAKEEEVKPAVNAKTDDNVHVPW